MRTTIILAVLAASALAGPTGQRSTCALHCTDSDTFKYETGKSYLYDYSVTTSTALLGTFDDDAQMHITANAQIDVTSPCEYVLKLTDVQLEGSSHGAEFGEAIMKNPLRFSFQDGVVESLCSEVSEPNWVLNFKRGVLSTFQNSMNHLHQEEVQETDISGECTAHYEVTSEGSVLSVEKVKDMSSCTHRRDVAAYVMSTGYATDSPVQSLPIFKSTNKCLQKIEDGILKEAECEESHKYRPFSSEEGGAVTTAKNTMRLVSQQQTADITADFEFTSTSLVFDEESSTKSEAKIDVVEKILNDLKAASQEEIRPEVPVLFSNLVASLKTLDYPQLSNIYKNIQDPQVKKFLIDATPLVGTASAAGILRDMVMNGELTETETDFWFTSLAFLKNPDPEMFIAIAPLLEENPSQKSMLGTSALVNNYCKIHSDCESDSGVIQIIRRIEAQLGSSCRAINEEEKSKILIALKALGNAGRWINANSVLRRCYAEEENDMEIRVAALEAWRHTPCEYDRSNVQAAFQDETQDPEVRIAAYLALMSCPTQTLVDVLKERLTSEGVNQVGSFVWTHLSNLQESASPEKQWMRQLIGEELLQNKFSTDALKFSRNYESSFFMNELNTGASVESNMIFSSKSYLPRSAMLNLTVDLFGESINFFEVGGRIEGFEYYAERFFGPNGYFPEETVEGVLKNMREQKTDHEPTTLEGFLDKATDEPQGSYYLRVFGNELHYHHFHGLENVMRTSGATNPLEFLMELARKGDVDYSKSYQLFDNHYIIPTISGLPLSLTAKGTATLGIQMNGKFKVRSLKNVDIEGHFHPSAAVEIDGLMVVDAHVTQTGMKITSNLHTSTFLDGKIKLHKGKLVDIAFNTPKEKVEVINVQTKFFYLENDEETEKDVDNKVVSDSCTPGTTGFELCGEYSYTPRSESSPMFPFVGPFGTHVYFKKTDTHTGYVLRFEHERNEISFTADTPGSEKDHRIFVNLAKSDNALTLDVQTPFKSAQGSGEYTWQTNNKNAKMTLMLDGQQYGMDASLIIDRKSKKFEPSLVITAPNGELMNMKVTFQKGEMSFETDLELKTPVFETAVKNKFSYVTDSFVSFDTDAEYKMVNGNKQTIHQTFLIKKEVSDQAGTYSVTFDFIPSEFSDLSLELDYKTVVANLGHIESTGKLIRGPVTWEAEHLWLYTSEGGQRKLEAKLAIKCPYRNVDYLASLNLSHSSNSVQSDLLLRGIPGKDLSITASLSKNRDVEINGNIATQFGDFKAAFEVTYNKISAGHHKLQIITKHRDETCLLEGTLKNTSSQGQINAVIDGLCKCTGYDIKSSLAIQADYGKATVDMKTNVNGHDYTARIEGSATSVLIDINIIKHVLLNAYVTTSEEIGKLLINAEWDKDVDPTKTFVVEGELSPKAIHLNLKFVEKELLLSSKLLARGAELEAKWASDKRVFCTISYSLGETTYLTATVETPFTGWEKQDATFNISLKEHEIESHFAATWKNSEQVSLIVKANVQPGMFTNAMTANILFTSSLSNFERMTFLLEHSMIDTKINSKIEGIWNDKELKGNFNLHPSENGIEGRLNFVSSFTEEVLITLSHKVSDKSLDSSIEAKYGAETSTVTLKGHVDFSDVHEVALVFKVNTPLAEVPEISAKINYNNDGSLLKLDIDGIMGAQKLMLSMNGSLIKGETTHIKGDLRFITPFTYPLTTTFKHQYSQQTFTSEFEMSRIWSSFGNLKLHAEGQMISKSNMKLSAVLSSPANKASISFIHNVAEKKMVSSIDASLNAERFYVSVGGVLDVASNLADLEAEIASTFNELDDIKVTIRSEKTGEIRTSKIIFSKGDKSINIDHTININDLLNWENSFNVNGIYLLKNKQTHSGNGYTHELEYAWNSEAVHLDISFDKAQNGNLNEVNTQVLLKSPWTEDMKGELHLKYDNVEYNPLIVIEYSPGKKIELDNTIKFDEAFFYMESTMTTPFWQSLGYKFNVDYKPRPAITLVLVRGDAKTTIDIGGTYESGKLDGILEIHSTYLALPITVEASYDILAEVKSAQLAVTYDIKYEITGVLSGNTKAAKWSLVTELPTEMVQRMEFSGEYNVIEMPLSAKVSFMLNSKRYEVNGVLSSNDFAVNFNLDEHKGSLSSNWSYSHNNANINIIFESPLAAVDNFSVYVMYDLTSEKKVSIKLTNGTKEISITGKLENETILVNGTTPFTGWEILKASFFMSESAISAFVSRNDRKIEVTGSLHVKPAKGKISLVITTPYANFEQISADVVYSFQGPIKNVELKSTFGTQQIEALGTIDVTDGLAPEMKLDITTPFDIVNKLGGLVKWNFKMDTKTAVVKTYRNDLEYHWELEATADNLHKAHATTKIATPISGWTSINIEGSFDFTSMPYKFAFTFEKEGVIKAFTGNCNIDRNTISAEFITPVTGWEKIMLTGDYTFERDHLTLTTEIARDSEKYHLSGDILFNSQKPKLNMTLKTPISYASNIEFILDSNLVDSNKKFLVSLKIDETLYSLDFDGQLLHKIGHVKLTTHSPIPGYSTFEISTHFDFTGEVKTAEVDLIKEGQNQHISVAARVNDNNIFIEIQTPLKGFEIMQFNGDYSAYEGRPIVQASFMKDNQKYEIKTVFLPEDLTVSLKISTPIETMKNMELSAKYALLRNGIEGSLHFEKDQEIFDLSTQVNFTPAKSDLAVSFTTPIPGWREMILNVHYDVQSEKKSAVLLVQKDAVVKKMSIEGSYDLKSGSFKIETPVDGFRIFGAEYTLNLNERNNQLDSSVKFYQESKEWTFAAQGEYHSNHILIKFETPFEGFKIIAAKGKIDFHSKTGDGVIEFGEYKFTANISYAKENALFKITTPFDILKIVSVDVKYTWTEENNDAIIRFIYNDKEYALQGVLKLSQETSEILLHATTPFQSFSNMTLKTKYDVNNRDELASIQITVNTETYGLKVGGYLEDKILLLTCEATSPFSGWSNVKFITKLDLTLEDKHLEITLERDGNIKAISISGKLIGNSVNFNLKTPFSGLNDFKIFGSLNRAKRSLEFQMMGDASEASLAANFNSVSLHLKTPFEVAEEIKWEIVKINENTVKAEWKRNENYITISVTKQGKKSAFNVEIKSEFQGWEFMALSGRLDQETLSGYLSGQLKEDKVTVTGSGSFDTKGSFNLRIETPYDNFKSVEVTLTYNVRKGTAKFEAASSSSNFHFILARDRSGTITHHSIYPHPEQPTEVTINLGIYKGKVTVTSRFPALRDYYQEYNADVGSVIAADHIIKWNDLEVFKMNLNRDGPNKKLNLEMYFRRPGHHTTIELQRDGYSSAHILAKRDDKEFRIDVQGSGNLPTQGELDFDINNSFREVPRNIKVHVIFNVQRSADRKQIKVEVTPRRGQLYIFDLDYSINTSNLKHGDFNLRITTPDRSMASWKNMSGSWDVEDPNNNNIKMQIGGQEAVIKGKLTLLESTLELIPADRNVEKIFLQWTFKRSGDMRDYFWKFGSESKYEMLKLKGTITDYAHVDVEGGFKVPGRLMSNDFLFTSKWNKESGGAVNGGGSYEYGDYHGEHTVSFNRDASRRSATFEASVTSNVPSYERIHLSGNYDFDHKTVIHIVLKANDRESKIEVNFLDIDPSHSRNTIHVNIPIFGSYGKVELTFSHDFRQATAKSFSAIATFSTSEAYVKANWNRSASLDTLEANIDIKSRFIGEMNVKANFDLSNTADAHAEVTYSRTTSGGETRNASMKWFRKRTSDHLETEMVVDTPFEFLKHQRIYVKADFSGIFHLTSGAEYNDKKVTFDLDIKKKSITGKITTPIENFELIEGSINFNLGGKTKTVQLVYERGTRKVNLDFTLNMKPKKEGDFDLTLTTPFDFVRNLHIDGKWNKKKAEINYQRNDIALSFHGKADIKADKSSFDMSFSPPSGQQIRIAGSYDVGEFLEGTGSSEKKIVSLELEFDGNRLATNIHGYRNTDRLYLELDGQSSFARVKIFHLKLDSQLNTQLREGKFEVKVNDFELKVDNHFEKRGSDGYYFKCQVQSTLTPLPALIFGIGREGEERIVTIGYDDDKEITFSIRGKNHFESGFSGHVDIPNFGYEGVKYDVEYEFENSNELHVKIEAELGSDNELEAHFIYNSDGIEARLNSFVTGAHSMRVRRSVSSEGFFAEAGVDEYNLKLRGGFNSGDAKRGLLLEGEVFGNTFLIDALLQSEGLQYTEGKLIIQTPFHGWETIGGLFTWAYVNNKVISHAELMLPSYSTPKITTEINLDLNKKVDGYVTLDFSGEEFTLKSHLVGTSVEGYKGSFELYTPFHSVSYVSISGNMKMEDLTSLDTNLKIIAPFATHEIKVNYKLDVNKVTADIVLQSSRLDNTYNISIEMEKTDSTAAKIHLDINSDQITAEYKLQDKVFMMNIDSLVMDIHRQFSVEAKYASLDNMEGTLLVTLWNTTHKIHGNMNIASNRIQSTFDLESDLIDGQRKLSFDILLPSPSYKQVTCDLVFVTEQSHSMHFDFDAETSSGIHLVFKIDTPLFPKITTTVDFTVATAGISVETPQGTHKLLATWRETRKMPADWMGNLELASPFLPVDYTFGIVVGGNQEKRTLQAELSAGSVKHLIEGYASMSHNGGSFSLNIETPIKAINRASIEASLSFETKVTMHISSTFANKINTFDLSFDKQSKVFMATVESPFIPTGMVKAEAQLAGEINKNMRVKIDLMNKAQSISGVFSVKVISSQNMETNIKITTPFKGYKKMNFSAKYMKNGDDVTILLVTEKPVKFNAELHLSNLGDNIKTDIKIDTEIKDFATIEGHLLIPLNRFEPQVSANVMVDGEYYGGHLGVRTKAPFELTYGLHLADWINSKFHLRTDSSFFSFLL